MIPHICGGGWQILCQMAIRPKSVSTIGWLMWNVGIDVFMAPKWWITEHKLCRWQTPSLVGELYERWRTRVIYYGSWTIKFCSAIDQKWLFCGNALFKMISCCDPTTDTRCKWCYSVHNDLKKGNVQESLETVWTERWTFGVELRGCNSWLYFHSTSPAEGCGA